MEGERKLSIRIPEQELKILEAYCTQTSRTKTDVLREYIRSLLKKLKDSEGL
ncbi:ribbon-helix-helix protein, CopG family [Scytonema sp. NUACC21]